MSIVSGTPLCERLVGLLRRKGQGKISRESLVDVISTVYSGSEDDRVALTFACYDLLEQGAVEREKIQDFFAESWVCTWKLMSEHLEFQRKTGGTELPSAADLARVAEKSKLKVRKAVERRLEWAYAASGADGSIQRINLQEFKKFVTAPTRLDLTAAVGPDSLHVATDFVHIAGFESPVQRAVATT